MVPRLTLHRLLTAAELKDGVNSKAEETCRAIMRFFHFLLSEILDSEARLHTPAACCLGVRLYISLSFFTDEIRGNPQAAHDGLHTFFFVFPSQEFSVTCFFSINTGTAPRSN
ncbi:hypothetical protein ILYODFUR_037274 [Ilyodon furcidens]|uniref:Uncharacterized protein n=1 Tax=Ilyodon furcidens TaxID=33524 RepID=A0ABV0TQ18_9TELE